MSISLSLMTVLLFGSMIVLLVLGFPVAFALAGTALIFTLILWGPSGLYVLVTSALGMMDSFIFIAVPMFVFMAVVLENAGLAEDLYTMMHRVAGSVKGGLAIGTVLICTIFAAMSGISGAATVTMGVIALPQMLKRNYHQGIAMGCIGAGGALGILIPPSVPMVIYALLSGESVGKLFLGGIIPGSVLSTLFIGYIYIRCKLRPEMGPPLPLEERVTVKEKLASLKAVILPILLVLAVLGSIFTGIATPSEAAGIGALGSIVCAIVNRKLTWKLVLHSCTTTCRLCGMMIWIAIGSTAFAAVYNALGGQAFVIQLMTGLGIGRWGILILMQIIFIIMGCLMDSVPIMFITTPIFVPIIKALGFDPLWFGVLFVVNMEMSYLTPPFGFNLFYLRSVTPPSITMGDIYRAVFPFILLQLAGLIMVMIFPELILWLPSFLK